MVGEGYMNRNEDEQGVKMRFIGVIMAQGMIL